ncbi:MAG: EAL domain-containing protein [Gammaproteobacteria bacterium]
MDSENLVRLLVVHDSLNDAEKLGSILRDSGYAVRVNRVVDAEDFTEALERGDLDLVFCATELDNFTLDQAVDLLKKQLPGVPLIGMADRSGMDEVSAAMKAGAYDVVGLGHPEHIVFVVRRELAALKGRREAEDWQRAYRGSENRARVLLDTSRDAITYVRDGMHMYANPAYLRMFGFQNPDDVEGLPIMDMVASKDQSRFKPLLRMQGQQDDGTASKQVEIEAVRDDGKPFKVSMEFASATFEDEDCIQITIHDHTVTRELAAKVRELKKRDALTGLLNRQAFLEELNRKLSAQASHWALVHLDLDNFERIREATGITSADKVVKDLASLICQRIDLDYVAARFSDHAFALLLRLNTEKAAVQFADELRKDIEGHISDVDGQSVATTASAGVTLLKYGDEGGARLMTLVERACDAARDEGGNTIRFANPQAERDAENQERQWALKIRDALKRNSFQLHYQPIGSLRGEAAEKYEVMLRMIAEDGELLYPARFLSAARQYGLGTAIDRWVIANALHVLAHRVRRGIQTQFFVKVTTETILDGSFVVWLAGRLKAFGMNGRNMVIELDAEDVATHIRETRGMIDRLGRMGCTLAIDHFNGGSNTLQLLNNTPFKYIKVSGRIIRALGTDKNAEARLKAICDAARTSSTKTVATQVEDANMLAALWKTGVDFIQGDFLQEPAEHLNFDFVGEMMTG